MQQVKLGCITRKQGLLKLLTTLKNKQKGTHAGFGLPDAGILAIGLEAKEAIWAAFSDQLATLTRIV